MNSSKHVVRTSYKHYENDLNLLERVMKKSNIPEMFYSIGSYMEEAVCIEEKNKHWIIYEGERGKQYNLKTYKDLRCACHDFLSRVSESNEQEKMLRHLFDIAQRRGSPFFFYIS